MFSIIMSAISAVVSLLSVEGLVGVGVGIAAFTGIGAGIGIGIAASKTVEAIARQPEAEKKIFKSFMLGIVFAETTAILGFVTAIMLIIS